MTSKTSLRCGIGSPGASRARALLVRGMALALAAALGLSPAVARADDAADRATARALASEGHQALLKKDFATALDRFRRANQLVSAPTLTVGAARSLAGLGRLVEAEEAYQRVLREGVAPDAPLAWKRALEHAREELAELQPRLAWITITVSGPESAEVYLDDKILPPATIGVRRASDPGKRTVRATAEGFVPAEQTVILGEGDHKSLELTLQPDPNAAAAEAPPQVEVAAPPLTAEERPKTAAYVALGVGGVAVIGGIVTGLMTMSTKDDLEERCMGVDCGPGDRDTLDRYRTLGTISAVGFGVGAVGLGAGIALLLTNPSMEQPRDQGKPKVQPYIGWASIGAVGQF